ncbi:Intermembrane transport protein PqiA [Paraburkholderia rhynchosiae]|uniref:Intermembrane transport protein PqiA n=2 Tax=Paraburkholderia rhynchosiae TaxID=487049 RepID=A0A6J5C7B5_9BURK|nr:Intermembrane transport protein PqiA [Paraburkholderia rhynchosiae]
MMNETRLIACPECDLLQSRPPRSRRGATKCGRCGATLSQRASATRDLTLALSLAATVLFVVANCFPIVGVWVNGALVETTLVNAALSLYADGMWPIAGLVFVTTFLMPALNMAAMIYLLLPLYFGRSPPGPQLVLRLLRHFAPWGMIEVFMLALLVAIVKLQHVATVMPGIGLWALGAVMVLLAIVAVIFDPLDLWAHIDRARPEAWPEGRPEARPEVHLDVAWIATASERFRTAARAGLYRCNGCGLLARPLLQSQAGSCPRCNSSLHPRKHNSLTRTWAFILAATVLYIPSLLLPIMVTGTLFNAQSDTILSGVVYLWSSGSWLLAAIVFMASIVVPMLKVLSLTYLACSTQLRSPSVPTRRTRLYRLIELIGRWSMLDIYVITILVAVVQFDSVATIDAGPGAIAFGGVVVLTMFATLSFDPRLIWDAVETEVE